MNIECFDSQPDIGLAVALEQFESRFQYPLGDSGWFRISHCEDYTCFFRAIGDTRCFVAKRDDEVVGVISAMICRLRQPGADFQRCGYLSDLKVSESVSGRTLLGLLRAATDWVHAEPTPGFCVVMDGTAKIPTSYTGRLGIPQFRELCKLMILRIPCVGLAVHTDCQTHLTDDVQSLYRELTSQRFATNAGDMSVRSQMNPIGIITASGDACGILEDTRRGKRLFDSSGAEMVSAHLSCFGYRDATAASNLIHGAVEQCRRIKLPALFVAIPMMEAKNIVPQLRLKHIVEAPATVFGYDLNDQGTWSINSSEI